MDNIFKARASKAGLLLVGASYWTSEDQEKLDACIEKYEKALAAKRGTKGVEADIAKLNAKKEAGFQLGKTGLGYVREQWLKDKYQYKQEVKTDVLKKGHINEQDGIQLADELMPFDYTLRLKCNESKEDEYFKGTCDIDLPDDDAVEDIKSRFELSSFQSDKLEQLYVDQLNVYGRLYGRKTLRLWSTLTDTPAHILERLDKGLMYSFGGPEVLEDNKVIEAQFLEARAQLIHNHTPSKWLPAEDRAKVWEFKRDDERLELLIKAVKAARVVYDQMTLADPDLQPWKSK